MTRRIAAVGLALVLAVSACGDDDEDAVDDTTTVPSNQDVGDGLPDSLPPGTIPPFETPSDAEDYVGLSKAEAEAKAEEDGRVFRIVQEDETIPTITDELMSNRINVTIMDGVVTKAEYY